MATEPIQSLCIFLLPDNVFCESSPPRSLEEKQARAKRTFEEMMSYIPGIQVCCSYPRLLSSPHLRIKPRSARQRVISKAIYLSDFLGKCMGEEAKYEGIRLLFDGLQQPILNKQVRRYKDKLADVCSPLTPCWEREDIASETALWLFVLPPLTQLTYVLLDIAIQELFPELNRVTLMPSSFP